MKDYLEHQIRNAKSFGELLGNLFLLTTYHSEYTKFLILIRENYWPRVPSDADSNALLLDLVRRFECWTTEQPNRYWKTMIVKNQHALVAGSPLSPEAFYAPDYDAAIIHCIVVLEIKSEDLI